MVGLLALLFLVVPIAELYVIVQVAGGIGVGNTILLLIAISVGGAWLAKWSGVGVLRRLQATVRQGRVPSAELVDGALVLLAGALMLTPGFLSDALGGPAAAAAHARRVPRHHPAPHPRRRRARHGRRRRPRPGRAAPRRHRGVGRRQLGGPADAARASGPRHMTTAADHRAGVHRGHR